MTPMGQLKAAARSGLRSVGYELHKANTASSPFTASEGFYQAIYGSGAVAERRFYNFGSGDWRHPCWTNIDYHSAYYAYDGGLIDICWDISKLTPLPVKEGSAELAYCSHTVEHLTNEQTDHVFIEMVRALRKGGVARITTPNIRLYYEAYKRRDVYFNLHYGHDYPFGATAGGFRPETMAVWLVNEMATQLVQSIASANHKPSYTDVRELDAIFESRPMEAALDYFMGQIDYELQREAPGHHVNWWTHEKLSNRLLAAGFSEVIVSAPGQSIAAVMRNRRFFDTVMPTASLFVDAVK